MSSPKQSSPREWGRFTDGSVEQRMLLALGAHVGVPLRPRPLSLAHGARVEVEGMDPDGTIVVQLVANQGTYKPSYRNKVMADMFKLLWLRTAVPGVARAALVVSAPTTQALNGWVAIAAAELGVEVYVFGGDDVVPLTGQS